MSETESNPASKRRRKAIGLRAPKLAGDYTAIRIPIPPASAYEQETGPSPV